MKKIKLSLLLLCAFSFLANAQVIEIKKNWKLQAQDKIKVSGKELSSQSDVSTWYNATVPQTVMAALVENGVYKDPYFSDNISKIPTAQFEQAWWYVNTFTVDNFDTTNAATLFLDGINYKANIWLNGKLIADSSKTKGVFSTFDYVVTEHITKGKNTIAVQIFPPKAGDFTMGFVDWAPIPPDKNMGIWREVKLEINKKIGIHHSFVNPTFKKSSLDASSLVISTEITNFSNKPQDAVIKGEIDKITFSKKFHLAANETRKIFFNSSEFPQLVINKPKLWWPNGLGEPNMYKLKLTAEIDNQKSDEQIVDFGIRKLEQYFNDKGHRGYKVNNQPVLIKGGGWVDALFLENTTAYNTAQVQYTKDMGLNCIRFEGFWGTSPEIYSLCDKYGLLAMVGFSCQWEWHDYIGGKTFNEEEDGFGAVLEKHEMDLVADYFLDMTKWLRNHPSVFAWLGGSDRLHKPELEKRYLEIIKNENPDALYCGAAKSKVSAVTGPTGVKMEGPYDYVPPMYWFTDTLRGGAFGFNTETGPGPQPPVIESMKKMLPRSSWWPIDTTLWNFHSGRHAFKDMERFNKPLFERYGNMYSLEDYCTWSQVQSYELMRPMFEAFVINQPNTTGIVQWMLNSAWPETFWQLYDYYLYPTGAFYGCKKANQNILVAYNYRNQKIYLANESLITYKNLKTDITIYNSESKVIFTKSITSNSDAHSVQELLQITEQKDPHGIYFISLKVTNELKQTLSENFYWISNKKDKMDPNPKNASWIYTPTIENGDLRYLRNLPKSKVNFTFEEVKQVTGTRKKYKVMLENTTSNISFFNQITLKNKSNNEWILPVSWSDNYISLLPNEKKEITVEVDAEQVQNKEVFIELKGTNLE